MEKRRKLLFLAGLALVVAALSFAVYSNAGAINIVSKHSTPGATTNTECLSCHDNILVQTSPANPTTNPALSAHKRHIMSVFLNFANNTYSLGIGIGGQNDKGCVKCHEGTDIVNDSGVPAALRKHVDPQVCLKCHGKFDTTVTDDVHGTGANTVDKTNPRGCSPLGEAAGTCHGATAPGLNSPSGAHSNANWINTTYAASGNYCLKCHGAYTWYLQEETN